MVLVVVLLLGVWFLVVIEVMWGSLVRIVWDLWILLIGVY